MLNFFKWGETKKADPPQETATGGGQTLPDILDLEQDGVRVIDRSSEIQRILSHQERTKASVMLIPSMLDTVIPGRILFSNRIDDYLLVRTDLKEAEQADLKDSGQINLILNHQDERIIFTVPNLGLDEHEGVACHRLWFPQFGFGIQLRDSVRVALPPSQQARLRIPREGKTDIELKVLDISDGGICLSTDEATASQLTQGMPLDRVALFCKSLQAHGLQLKVRYLRKISQEKVLVGLQFRTIPEVTLQQIRRLILQIQSSSHREV